MHRSCNPGASQLQPGCIAAATLRARPASTPSAQVRANWLDTLLHAHFNRTLWRRVAAEWPGERGGAALRAELARFRALRAAVRRRCGACEAAGVGPCLARARAAPAAEVTPHLCWMLSQETLILSLTLTLTLTPTPTPTLTLALTLSPTPAPTLTQSLTPTPTPTLTRST